MTTTNKTVKTRQPWWKARWLWLRHRLQSLKKNGHGKDKHHQPTTDKEIKKQPATTSSPHQANTDYFTRASRWADDYYALAVASRQRYQVAFLMAMAAVVLMSVALVMLIPTEHFLPIQVTQYSDGDVLVSPLKNPQPPTNAAQTQSHLVRYVINRESFSADSYDVQYRYVLLMSNHGVARDYQSLQTSSNPKSPINTLGRKKVRSVQVESVLFLDKANRPRDINDKGPHSNLAQVNFTVTTRDRASGERLTLPMTALVSWTYRGTPQDPDALWQNWDGFEVTRYDLQQRSLAPLRGHQP